MDVEVITTDDGSHSVRHLKLNETYHSTHGALRESRHVFIAAGFDHVAASATEHLDLLEVGFGTGLNALLTAIAAVKRKIKTHYVSLETDPLPEKVVAALNYPTLMQAPPSGAMFKTLHDAPWNSRVEINEFFSLTKVARGIMDAELPDLSFDLVYFDAFAPNKQPEMWTTSVLDKTRCAMRSGAVLVTYCAKGQVKRDLRSLGFRVEALPGPPGKREMLRAYVA